VTVLARLGPPLNVVVSAVLVAAAVLKTPTEEDLGSVTKLARLGPPLNVVSAVRETPTQEDLGS
jgi:hypothetical protein